MKRTTLILLALASVALPLSGCTTAEPIRQPGGGLGYVIGCGAATGWNICYRKANALCPAGYRTISREGGFNRKELTIDCAVPGSAPA